MTAMKTVDEIIDAAGPGRLWTKIGQMHRAGMLQRGLKDSSAISHWRRNGIPARYWPAVIACTGVTVDELYAANEKLREERNREAA